MGAEAREEMERLREIDAVILRTAEHGARLIQAHADVGQVHAQVDFLRTLYRRRDGILRILHQMGYSDGDIYGRWGHCAGGECDGHGQAAGDGAHAHGRPDAD